MYTLCKYFSHPIDHLKSTHVNVSLQFIGLSNEEVRNRTRQATGPHEDLLTTVKQRKLKWYEHVTRSSGLAKTILEGTVQGGRRRGRQKEMGGQHPGMDWHDAGHHHEEG